MTSQRAGCKQVERVARALCVLRKDVCSRCGVDGLGVHWQAVFQCLLDQARNQGPPRGTVAAEKALGVRSLPPRVPSPLVVCATLGSGLTSLNSFHIRKMRTVMYAGGTFWAGNTVIVRKGVVELSGRGVCGPPFGES